MYNTDSYILKQICKLLQSILKKYTLTDEEIYTITDARSIVMKLTRKIEGKE
jgi:hypothetical protein